MVVAQTKNQTGKKRPAGYGLKLKHLAIIPDGNRRYASKKGLVAWLGHENGIDKMKDLASWVFQDFGIKTLTIYAFSTENFQRSGREVRKLMQLFAETFEKMKTDPTIHNNRVRVVTVGRVNLLPKRVRHALSELEKCTKTYGRHRLNLAIAYDGREEIISAVKKMVKEHLPITKRSLERSLWLSQTPPDLIIRTSGETRLSGFLLWQGSYSELYFSKKLWPEFKKSDLALAIRTFERRNRRFGK